MIFRPKYPIEALLRPPVEFHSATAALIISLIMYKMPQILLMSQHMAYVGSAIFVLIGLARFRQGYKIYRYQKNLVRLPYYGMRPRQVPVSNRTLFLGLGFRWTQKHTQRLFDAMEPENEKYITPPKIYQWARLLEKRLERFKIAGYLIVLLSSNSRFNPVRPLPPVGGNPAIHAVGMLEGEYSVDMPLGERVGHTLVLGTTRVGKTRLAEILITQDIRRGDVVVVFDPKGDADLMMRCQIEAKRAGRPFYMFHLGFPEVSARYNGIGNFSKVTEPAGRLSDALPSEGNSSAFKEFAWRFANIIVQADVALGNKPSYHSVRKYVNNIEPLLLKYGKMILGKLAPEGWEKLYHQILDNLDPKTLPFSLKDRNPEAIALLKYCEATEFYDAVLDGLLGAFKYDRSYFDKIVSSLAPLLEKLTTGRAAELIAPDYQDVTDKRPIFDWMSAIRQKAVVYVGLDALSDSTVASAVGASMFADLTSVSGFLYKNGITLGLPEMQTGQRKVSIHADEFNELVGDQFIPMINKAGGAGYQVTAYTQTESDIEARIGSKSKAGQIKGNFNNLIMLRVKEPTTAEILTSQLPKVRVNELMAVTGANDSSDVGSGVDFTSKNEDRTSKREVDMIDVSTVMSLPKGQAFALIEGGQLYKIRMPLPEKEDDPKIKTEFSDVYGEMVAKYNTGEGLMSRNNDWLSVAKVAA
ncbi:type IV conjugative transfer system coupling protein TraD [Thiomicrorhabdus indica]|uniref:type IV conjugative transfer system coupling protein TraD n=1 Tax=Thiomicrorhabdus indica TaxID=2267253 RepID=UPI00102D79E8|nr:type IV conjugative transfer system coupling protein TraD [Thiomicrorhabdus indica]